jgi:hypothetical protein
MLPRILKTHRPLNQGKGAVRQIKRSITTCAGCLITHF